jgi:hypothetical protein
VLPGRDHQAESLGAHGPHRTRSAALARPGPPRGRRSRRAAVAASALSGRIFGSAVAVGWVKRSATQHFSAFVLLFAASPAIAEICDKGEFFDQPLHAAVAAGALFFGPFGLYLLRRKWSDGIGGVWAGFNLLLFLILLFGTFLPVNHTDPFVAGMKAEGCLGEPGWLGRVVVALMVVAYAAIFEAMRRRLFEPNRS